MIQDLTPSFPVAKPRVTDARFKPDPELPKGRLLEFRFDSLRAIAQAVMHDSRPDPYPDSLQEILASFR